MRASTICALRAHKDKGGKSADVPQPFRRACSSSGASCFSACNAPKLTTRSQVDVTPPTSTLEQVVNFGASAHTVGYQGRSHLIVKKASGLAQAFRARPRLIDRLLLSEKRKGFGRKRKGLGKQRKDLEDKVSWEREKPSARARSSSGASC